ncbi:MAG TPA: LPP20 family lipoprotein, partial [Polyangia bacterium]
MAGKLARESIGLLPRWGLLSLLVLAHACASSQPGWVNEPYREYSKERYVVAVGSGRTFDAARQDAMKGIAAFLGVDINAQTGVRERATAEGRNGRHVADSSHLEAEDSVSQIINARLSSVVIEKAHSSGDTTYVLALLDKRTFLVGLGEEADNAAGALAAGLKAAGDNPSPNTLTSLQSNAQRLQALQGKVSALGGTVSPTARAALQDSVNLLAKFDITVVVATPAPQVVVVNSAPSPGASSGTSCDANDPRLRKSMADTAAQVGHPVQFRFNLAQLPKRQWFCDHLFESYIGLIPKDLAALKQRTPGAFTYGAPALKVIDFDYDGTADRVETTFDRSAGRLRIAMTDRVGYLLPSDVVSFSFEKDYETWVLAHFEGVEPNKVARHEWPLYYDYLTHLLCYGKNKPAATRYKRSKDEEIAQSYEAVATVKMVRFYATVGPDALSGKIRDWLLERYETFGRAYFHNLGEVQRARDGSPFKQAERAWVEWLNASFDGLPDGKKVVLLDILNSTMPAHNPEGLVWNDGQYPGLHSYDMGLGIIDRWRAA